MSTRVLNPWHHLAVLLSVSPAFASTAGAVEREIVIDSDAGAPIGLCRLGATLDLPDHAAALVVFVHGSGPQNRDERIGSAAPFRDIAQALSAREIGSLRFDKRGTTQDCLPAVAGKDIRPEHFLKDIEAVYRRARLGRRLAAAKWDSVSKPAAEPLPAIGLLRSWAARDVE